MFFLGGFNSIIPYLIYISLIWVFMAIGFHGQIVKTWHVLASKEYQKEISINQAPCNQIPLFQKKAGFKQHKMAACRLADFFFFHTVIDPDIIIPLNSARNTPACLHSFTLRGPPGMRS